MRPNNRANNQVREIKITRNYTRYAEGSVLIEFGETKVLCNATVEESVPRFLKVSNKVGLPQNMVCCHEPPTLALSVKRQKANKADAQWKSNA